MVYYHTSANVKMLRNIVIDYGASSEVSAYEYMKTYIGKCPDNTEDAKLSWIVETFLSFQKHGQFLKEIASHMSEELSAEDQDYFMIIFHAVTFQIDSKEMQLLYKCLFNLSKALLSTFTKFLSNNEVLSYISLVAQSSYDTTFITNKIIGPLFEWQPYIGEMAHTYEEYVKKVESRKLKPPTVPIQPKVLTRKSNKDRGTSSPQLLPSSPATPPNSLRNKKKRMLTKTVIDQKLKQIHEKNKQRASHLLNDVKNKECHYAQPKSDKYFKRISNIRDEIENEISKPLPKPKHPSILKSVPPPVKETAATIRRLNKRMQLAQQEEVEWMQDLVNFSGNAAKIQQITEYDRQEKERERLVDIERKHLMGQISYEEAVLAKKKMLTENKKKYEEFIKEKEYWNEEIEKWKKEQVESNRKHVEKLSMIELNILQAKNGVVLRNKETADSLKKESDEMREKVMKEKQEELERRINMIKEIKILAMVAKKAKVPKIIDLTETTAIGLLCEMSMAELQERLCAMKMSLKEELEIKRANIKEVNVNAKQELVETKNALQNYMSEREMIRKQNKKFNHITSDTSSSKEISDLRKILEEKRKIRMSLCN